MGESSDTPLKLQFDLRVRLDFRGATITSDAGLLACRELDAALGLTETANDYIHENRTGRNVQHPLLPLLRQSVYSRLAGYEDTNDPSVRVWRLIDRDEMSDPTRDGKISEGIHVLRRREIENYLWDEAVIRKALQNNGVAVNEIKNILAAYPFSNPSEDDMKTDNEQQALFEKIRNAEGASRLGRNRREFASDHLGPALRQTEEVYQELLEDVFPADLR